MAKIALADMIAELRDELMLAKARADARAGEDGKPLRFGIVDAEIELLVTASTEDVTSGGIKFWVINAGVDVKDGETIAQKLRLKLSPVDDDGNPYLVSRYDTR
jgi:hypothetical protein